MKKLLTLILLLSGFAAVAQDSNSLKLSGELMSNQRVLLDGGNWIWNEDRLTLDFEKSITGNSKFYSEVWMRNIGLPQYYSLSDLYNKNITDPWNAEIRQAYVSVYGLLGGKMDLTIGKQIINWGTADKFNPTNNLNPYDYEDVLDFGRKRGNFALRAQYYINDNYNVDLVYEPFFRPAALPVGAFSQLLGGSMEQMVSQLPYPVNSVSDSLILPSNKMADTYTAGVRLKGFAAGFDYSFSYVYGYDGLPYVSSNTLNYEFDLVFNGTTMVPVYRDGSLSTDLSFYRRHILGFDLAGNLAGVGVWFEGAAYIPATDVVMTTTVNSITLAGTQTQATDSLVMEKGKPYYKYVVGADYTFNNGIYLNTQFIHGFLHERKGDLNDYLFVRMEKSFFNDKLKLAPLSGAVAVSDWNDLENSYAWAYFPQIAYMPVDNIEIDLAAGLFGGKGEGLFSSLSDFNMFIFGVKYDF